MASGIWDGPRLDATLERTRLRIQTIEGVRIIDAQGRVARGTGAHPGTGIDVSDREFFVRLRVDKDPGLVVCKPVLGRIAPRWVMSLARRINRPDGSFGGVVQAAIELDYLARLFSRLDLGREGVITLRNPDLTNILRRPDFAEAGSDPALPKGLQQRLSAGQRTGTFTDAYPVDGVVRIHAFQQLRDHGQWIIVGVGQREALAGWRREALQAAVLGGLLLGVAALCAAFVLRAWRKETAMTEALQKALAEVKALSGLLPICSHCKKIRDDQGYWNQIESYIASHSAAEFTHGICPECARQFFPEIFERRAATGGFSERPPQ